MILQSAVPGSSDGVGDADELDDEEEVGVPEDVGEPDRTTLEADDVLVDDVLVVDGQESTPMSPWKETVQPELLLAEEVDVDDALVLVVDGHESTPMSPWKETVQPELLVVDETEVDEVPVGDDVCVVDAGVDDGRDVRVLLAGLLAASHILLSCAA